jgi:hypothetical protein
MCDKCVEIDKKIAQFRELARRIRDQQTLDGIAALITELETQKVAFHPEEKQ